LLQAAGILAGKLQKPTVNETRLNMTQKLRNYFFLLMVLLVPSIGYAADTALTVTGEVKTPLTLTLADLESMPVETIGAKDHDGSTASYQGVSLHTILVRAGVPQGENLRGPALRLCVLVEAADGYQVAFSVAELDPLFTDKETLLAYRRNGKELDSKAGPLKMVIPDEKRQARWVREVTGLEVVRASTASKDVMNH
jgi:DMSO/TMAO reductase YedYZ molybdopterin-dependent catalytic subunit